MNIGLVVGSESALLIDTGSSPEQGRLLKDAAEAFGKVPVLHVLVTHWHWDHYFGLAGTVTEDRSDICNGAHGNAGRGDGSVVTYGHISLPSWLDRPEVLKEAETLGVDANHLVAPEHLISGAALIDLGGVTVNVSFLGRGHTDGDLVAYVPQSNVLFVGDLVEEAGPPVVDFDSFVAEWPQTLDRVLALANRETLIIPGHGAVVDLNFACEQREHIAK